MVVVQVTESLFLEEIDLSGHQMDNCTIFPFYFFDAVLDKLPSHAVSLMKRIMPIRFRHTALDVVVTERLR